MRSLNDLFCPDNHTKTFVFFFFWSDLQSQGITACMMSEHQALHACMFFSWRSSDQNFLLSLPPSPSLPSPSFLPSLPSSQTLFTPRRTKALFLNTPKSSPKKIKDGGSLSSPGSSPARSTAQSPATTPVSPKKLWSSTQCSIFTFCRKYSSIASNYTRQSKETVIIYPVQFSSPSARSTAQCSATLIIFPDRKL